MSAAIALRRLERIVDVSGVPARIEALLPAGVRDRQLSARTLLLGVLLAAADHRPAHLTRVHAALLALPTNTQRRLGVLVDTPAGDHPLSYRQLEYTAKLIVSALSKPTPDGTPSEALAEVTDALMEASIQVCGPPASSSLAVDWTDHETFARPPTHAAGQCADPEASWGRRKRHGPGDNDELFFGYHLQVATTVKDEHGPHAPELVRRLCLTSCHIDPPPALVAVLARMVASGITLGDLLADIGYAYRIPQSFALPLRQLGAHLVIDLHPNDRGPHGTHMGATIANGNLYCPATPQPLLQLGPLARAATPEQTAAHDHQTAELAAYKLGRICRDDPDGYHRVGCPATQAKLRCPLRPASMTLPHDRPEILQPPDQSPLCCSQQTITVPPTVCAKTRQKHDYPSAAHRASYARRTAAERAYATTKDPATTNLTRGWCRIMGLAANTLFAAAHFIARNLRVHAAFAARQADNNRRTQAGLPPKTRRRRRRRRHTLADLTAQPAATATNAPP